MLNRIREKGEESQKAKGKSEKCYDVRVLGCYGVYKVWIHNDITTQRHNDITVQDKRQKAQDKSENKATGNRKKDKDNVKRETIILRNNEL